MYDFVHYDFKITSSFVLVKVLAHFFALFDFGTCKKLVDIKIHHIHHRLLVYHTVYTV